MVARRLWLPPSVKEEKKLTCLACGQTFFESEMKKYEYHVTNDCGDMEEYEKATAFLKRAPAFYDNYHPDFNDVEWQKWIDEHKKSDPHRWDKWGKTSEGKN